MDNSTVLLRRAVPDDLHRFFEFQLDPEGIHLAAFTPKDPTDQTAYLQKYSKLLENPTVHMRTIVVGGSIVGSVSKFELDGRAEITYWLDRSVWGRGVATAALADFLKVEPARPIFARVAFDNFGSQRVLEKCGFVRIGRDQGFANARQAEIEEYIYRLD